MLNGMLNGMDPSYEKKNQILMDIKLIFLSNSTNKIFYSAY